MDSILNLAKQVLTITPARWLEMTHTLPPELLSRPPAPGEWSAVQCLEHLIETERDVFPVRIRAYLAGLDFPSFDPETRPPSPQSPLALAGEFSRLRIEALELLAPLTDADLGRTARHSKLGIVSLSETMHTWAAHDLNHTVQAERAIMQPFIRGSGPFRFRFVDHEVKEHAT